MVARGWGVGRSDCLLGMEFPFRVKKMFWNLTLAHNIVNVLNVTELYLFKW